MKLSSFKRIIAEDFDEKDRPIVSKLAYAINVFADDVLNALDKNLSIEDNLNINKKEITASVDANGVPVVPISIKSGLNGPCFGIDVIRAINNTNPNISPTSCPFITYADINGQISVNKISGLQPNNRYTLRLVLYV